MQKRAQAKKIPTIGDNEVPKNPTFGNEETVEGRNSFRKQSELQRVSSHQVLKKNPI